MRCVERPQAVDANHQSWLAFSGFYTRASVPSTPTRIAGSICPETPEWSKDRAFTDVDDAQEASQQLWRASPKIPLPGGQRPATDVAVKLCVRLFKMLA